MKKFLVQYLLLLLPVFVLAQNDPPIYKDLFKKIVGITDSFNLNSNVSILQADIDGKTSELVAVNDKMEVLWRTTLKGVALGAGKFKGQILAVACAEKSISKGTAGPYTTFLVDPQTGKLILQKEVYQEVSDTYVIPQLNFNEDGLNFTLALRQTGNTRNLISVPFKKNRSNETKDFTLVNLNDKLDVSILKPNIPKENLLGLTLNKRGDLFVFVAQSDKTLKGLKYDAGKTEPSGSVTQDIDLNSKSDFEHSFEFYASRSDVNTAYVAVGHKNPEKDYELTVCKLDFNSSVGQTVDEVFDRAHRKSIEKAYVAFDKKLDKPVIGAGDYMIINDITETNGILLVTVSDLFRLSNTSTGAYQIQETSFIINAYDLNLKPKFQQVFPCQYSTAMGYNAAFYTANNSFYIVANSSGLLHLFALYGRLDLNTGSWLNMEKLAKGDIGKHDIADKFILWFKNGFVLPYEGYPGYFHRSSAFINLASYSY